MRLCPKMSQMSRNVPKCLFCREVVSDNVLFPLPTRFEIVRVLTIVVVAKLWSHCLKIIYMNDFNHFYPNTELGIDLKLLTCRPGRIETGKVINGRPLYLCSEPPAHKAQSRCQPAPLQRLLRQHHRRKPCLSALLQSPTHPGRRQARPILPTGGQRAPRDRTPCREEVHTRLTRQASHRLNVSVGNVRHKPLLIYIITN